ncbi:arsenate reductase family protein [Aliiroseovarius sp.]|uniref:arsenate reductase family protein n=1 Tax=Aliiroseovarius sp. TaxID=1872442 RepID=UPI003BA9FC4B
MRIWGLKSCDTCRKAVKELTGAGHEPDYVDVRADGVEGADLERFFAEFGEALVNRRSTTWRGLSEEDRERPPVELLSAHPTLMKRPVVEAGGVLTLGWGANERAQWLDKSV